MYSQFMMHGQKNIKLKEVSLCACANQTTLRPLVSIYVVLPTYLYVNCYLIGRN